jgi:hypothetical protein
MAVDPAKYPQAAKLDGLRAEAETAGHFYEWLMGRPGLHLVRYVGEVSIPACVNGPELVAEFLGIDYKAYEREKDAMLAEVRASSEGNA